MMWILGSLILVILVIFMLFYLTPYPFVWLLRSKKEEQREKGVPHQKDIEQGLIIRKGLTYPSQYPNATYDLYYDPKQDAKRVIIWIHGGSFISGSSIGTRNFGALMAEQGAIFCSINYTLAPRHHYPVQLQQIDEFLVSLPSLLKVEERSMPKAVYLGGDSAGANLAAAYACMKTTKGLMQKSKVLMKSTCRLTGLLLYCGPYDFCEDLSNPKLKEFRIAFQYLGWAYLGKKHWAKNAEARLASPYHQVSEAFPATYLCDGKKYSFLWQGRKLEAKLLAMQVMVSSRFYEDMPHEFQFDYVRYSKQAMQVLEDSIAFMDEVERKSLC